MKTRNSSNPQVYSNPIPSESVPAKIQTTDQLKMTEMRPSNVFTIEILNENLNRDIDPAPDQTPW